MSAARPWFAPRAWRALHPMCLVGLLAACATAAPQAVSSNRPDGEGYAGRGELVVRLAAADHGPLGVPLPVPIPGLAPHKAERATVELRYLGLDEFGRAQFLRHDVDTLAGAPVAAGGERLDASAGAEGAAAPDPLDTRRIVVDLRLARQIRIQGKIVEIVEATASGVVFRLY